MIVLLNRAIVVAAPNVVPLNERRVNVPLDCPAKSVEPTMKAPRVLRHCTVPGVTVVAPGAPVPV